MRKYPITLALEELNDIIDEHIINDCEGFLFLVNGNLAEYLDDYIYDNFGIEIDEEMCDDVLEYDNDIEYYVTYLPSDKNDSCKLFIEEARGRSGKYKMADLDNCCVYIFTDMPLKTIKETFYGGIVNFYELEECELDDDCEDCCRDCEECCEDCLDEDEDIFEECGCLDCTIGRYIERIMETGGCPDCIERTLQDFTVDLFEKIVVD